MSLIVAQEDAERTLKGGLVAPPVVVQATVVGAADVTPGVVLPGAQPLSKRIAKAARKKAAGAADAAAPAAATPVQTAVA